MDEIAENQSIRQKADRRVSNQGCEVERRIRVRRFADLYKTQLDSATSEIKSSDLADTYDGTKLAVKFLHASGWGPLLNLGYFEWIQLPLLVTGLNYFQKQLVEKSVALLNPKKNEIILDLACGNGFTTQYIARSGSKTTGIDLCKEHVDSAQQTYGQRDNITFIQGDATHLEKIAEQNSVDKIHCLEAAFHFGQEGRKALLNSAFHVLKPGGTFVLVDITWKTDDPKQINEVDHEQRFRQTWEMELFEPFELYRTKAKAIGFSEQAVLDWTKQVTVRLMDVAALTIRMGNLWFTRRLLQLARKDYSKLTVTDWQHLIAELQLSQRVLGQTRYAVYILRKP